MLRGRVPVLRGLACAAQEMAVYEQFVMVG